MAFSGNENHTITLAEAADWTANYRTANANEIKAHFFGQNAIQSILDQDGCVGIRIYYALDDEGVKQLIIVGADTDQNDLYNGVLAERSWPCPPFCTTHKSPLQET
jgi:hypothetical protein